VRSSLEMLRCAPAQSASPWLIRLRMVPTTAAVSAERRGIPPDTHSPRTCRHRLMLSGVPPDAPRAYHGGYAGDVSVAIPVRRGRDRDAAARRGVRETNERSVRAASVDASA